MGNPDPDIVVHGMKVHVNENMTGTQQAIKVHADLYVSAELMEIFKSRPRHYLGVLFRHMNVEVIDLSQFQLKPIGSRDYDAAARELKRIADNEWMPKSAIRFKWSHR